MNINFVKNIYSKVLVMGSFVNNDSISYDTYSSSNFSGDCFWISFEKSCELSVMYSL